MPSIPPSPDDSEFAGLDWDALRASAARRLRARLGGFGPQDLEDAVQEVLERFLGFTRRHGPPHTPEGLLFRLVRIVAANAIARRQRERAIEQGVVPIWRDPSGTDTGDDEILEEYQRVVFHVREYFRLKRAGCVKLADVKSRGESLKDHAAHAGISYDEVRQAWSRCVRLIHDAMRANRLQLHWLKPRAREAHGD